MSNEQAPSQSGQKPMLHSQRVKQQRAEHEKVTGKQAPPQKTIYFPLGYKDAAYQWWTSVSPPIAEKNVLSFIPYLREASARLHTPVPSASTPAATETDTSVDPYGPRVWRSTMVALSGKHRALNEFSVERLGEPATNNLVMLHGYGAGLGFFYRNYEALSRVPGFRLFSLDMLGMGNSSRPNFRVASRDPMERVDEAENWFIDALEEWRIIRKIDRFTLLGHSLGGYLATAYALKYPGHLDKLILVSPVGIPEDPYAVKPETVPEPAESGAGSSRVSVSSTSSEPIKGDNNNFMNARSKREAAGPTEDKKDPPRRPLPPWLVWLWESNFLSPFSVVRFGGPLGPRFASGWTSRRFGHLPEDEAAALHSYSYALFRQKGSGEFALPYILAPGAFARKPLIDRIAGIGRQPLPGSNGARETGMRVVFMYGEQDWMDVNGGLAGKKKLDKERERVLADPKTTDEERRQERGLARVVVVPKAGHNIHLDNYDAFNAEVVKELEETRKETLARRK